MIYALLKGRKALLWIQWSIFVYMLPIEASALFLFLISNRIVNRKWAPKFPHDGSSTNIFSLIIASVSRQTRPPKKPIFDSFRGYSRYLRSKFTEKIRRAADKSQCVPYFCMMLVGEYGVIQQQRPFGMICWIAWVTYPKPNSDMSRV